LVLRAEGGGGPEPWIIIVAVLLAWRIAMAAILPLSADEAYYLLWSHHLQAGYFDHPPVIAFLIRAGTLLLGDTPLGVRLMGLPLSLLATWFVWRTAAMLLKEEGKAAWAALLFNLTLMANVELLVATPDMPSIVTVAAFLWALAKVQTSGPMPGLATRDADAGAASAFAPTRTAPGEWWLAAGAAAGLSLLSKYSMLFVGLGTAVWLLADARGRTWLKTPWPWAGGVLALAVFAPNLMWQARHGWMTFAFQFGRMDHGALTWRYLAEFAGAQLGLATPLLLVLAAMGWWQARRPGGDGFPLFVIVAVTSLYFLQHALHDRVQGNWPCFLYPALAVLAADAVGRAPRWLSLSAAVLAGVMLLALYLQAAVGIVPLKRDPVARLLARDFPAAAKSLADSVPDGAVLTSDYETTALLRYYQPRLPVIQINEPWRYDWAPPPPAALLKKPLVYFTATRRDQSDQMAPDFGLMSAPLSHGPNYVGYLAEDPKPGADLGRMP
jgi:4-amino-4-deoxy-L-arabinose transferase-like glycosyltransferase